VGHVEDGDDCCRVVNRVPDPVLAAASPPVPLERFAERRSDTAGILGKRPEDELDAGRGGRLGKLLGEVSRS
jgi:hypothetical protein